MGMGENGVVIERIGKEVILYTNKKLYRWEHMVETLYWKWDGKMPTTMLVNTLKYIVNT
jgi:hypothetical protein